MRKFVSIVIVLLFAIQGFVFPVYADTDYLWLEAEDIADASEFSVEENESASGGELLRIFTDATPEDGGYSIELDAILNETGIYDIWILSTMGNVDNYSKYKWGLNDDELSYYQSSGEVCPEIYTHRSSGVPGVVSWSRLGKNITFNDCNNKIKFTIDEKTVSSIRGGQKYYAIIDAIVVVPSHYMWQPEANLDTPSIPPASFAVIQMEEPDNETIFSVSTSTNCSGGKMLYAHGLEPTDTEKTVETLRYSFVIDKDTEYDFWYLGSATDKASGHLSGMFWGIDKVPDVENTQDRNNVPQGDAIKIMDSVGATNSIPVFWQKLGTSELLSGIHEMAFSWIFRSIKADFTTWADCVLVIPSEWGWTPPTDESGDILPDYSIAWLDAMHIKEKYFSEDYSSIVDDIELPINDLKTPYGSIITFESENDGVISNEGVITRPYFNQDNVSTNFNIKANNAGKISSLKIPVTIIKLPKYSCSNFTVSGEIAAETQVTASAYIKVNAAAESGISGTATMVIAYYDEQGVLRKSNAVPASVGTTATELSATITLPEDLQGGFVKAYLLNNMSLGNRLADVVTLR